MINPISLVIARQVISQNQPINATSENTYQEVIKEAVKPVADLYQRTNYSMQMGVDALKMTLKENQDTENIILSSMSRTVNSAMTTEMRLKALEQYESTEKDFQDDSQGTTM
ncbi:MAG: hypothetical protein HOC71_14225 [Candidatus Latescibacteria bacterium]|mgnify:CR=1 FL=1|jgi:hypothetical protein|nr:hypothetical protein [Candidatus Latescibacterota bacterium]